jgi:glycosyltransferase involved in cell wall biosynthesis
MIIAEVLSYFYDGCIFISTNIKNYYVNRYKISKYILVPPLADSGSMTVEKAPIYNTGECFNIGLCGQIDINKEDLRIVLIAIKILKRAKYRIALNMYGPVTNKNMLIEIIEKYDLSEWVVLHGNIEYNHLYAQIKQNHLMLLYRMRNRQNKYGMPTKMADYLNCGIPILTNDVSDIGCYINDNINGFILKDGSVLKLVEKMKYIIDNYNDISMNIINASKDALNGLKYEMHANVIRRFILKI